MDLFLSIFSFNMLIFLSFLLRREIYKYETYGLEYSNLGNCFPVFGEMERFGDCNGVQDFIFGACPMLGGNNCLLFGASVTANG